MATEIITSFDQQCDANGDPMSGAKVYVYDVGTTTLKSVFSDTALSVSAANPIICDSVGRHDMRYIATGSYKIVVKTTADVTVYTRDNIDGRVPVGSGALAIANGGTGATTAGAALTALGGATAAELADVAADVAELAGTLAATDKTHIATGTTAQRPASPAEGDIRRNTTTTRWEGYVAAWQNFFTDNDIATQAQMETGTSTAVVVTPGRTQYHPGVAKAWGKFAGATGTVAVSHNVTSVVRNALGEYTITIATDFSGADYAILLSVEHSASADLRAATIAAGTFQIFARNGADSASIDPTSISFACFGDQA